MCIQRLCVQKIKSCEEGLDDSNARLVYTTDSWLAFTEDEKKAHELAYLAEKQRMEAEIEEVMKVRKAEIETNQKEAEAKIEEERKCWKSAEKKLKREMKVTEKRLKEEMNVERQKMEADMKDELDGRGSNLKYWHDDIARMGGDIIAELMKSKSKCLSGRVKKMKRQSVDLRTQFVDTPTNDLHKELWKVMGEMDGLKEKVDDACESIGDRVWYYTLSDHVSVFGL